MLRAPAQSHPLGVLPLGAAFIHPATTTATTSLGLFSSLPHSFIIDLLFPYLDDHTLLCLSQSSTSFRTLALNDDIWKSRTFSRFNGHFKFHCSWYSTYICTASNNSAPFIASISRPFYSDTLYASWRCATVPLNLLCSPSNDNIDRRSNLSIDQFITQYALPNKPVIITDIVHKWPAASKWSIDFFTSTYPTRLFRAEAVDIPFENYAKYLLNPPREESPLYLFDKHFADGTDLANDYSVPEYFAQDLFHVLGSKRPDYRWLIIGPARSGSTFHIDPNSTSAWNAVITGAKKWVMFPPGSIPPGVYPSSDGSQVTSPVSLAEWFLNHYTEARASKIKPIECVCKAGELIYVPNGWWHCVMNLSDSIAITQNFVSCENLANVLDFTEHKKDQVSGFCHGDLYTEFTNALQVACPDVLERAQESRRKMHQRKRCRIDASSSSSIASLWDKNINVDVSTTAQSSCSALFSFDIEE